MASVHSASGIMIDEPCPPLLQAFLERHSEMRPRAPIACPQGWDVPVTQALEELTALADEAGVRVELMQVKEKLAGLRIYLRVHAVPECEPHASKSHQPPLVGSSEVPGSARDRAHRIVEAAEARCAAMCQECGAAGQPRMKNGALCVLCDLHRH